MLDIEVTQNDDQEVQFAAQVLQNLAARFDLERFLVVKLAIQLGSHRCEFATELHDR